MMHGKRQRDALTFFLSKRRRQCEVFESVKQEARSLFIPPDLKINIDKAGQIRYILSRKYNKCPNIRTNYDG